MLVIDTAIISAAILVIVLLSWFSASTLEEHAALYDAPHYRVLALAQLAASGVAVTVLATYAFGAARLLEATQ